MADAPFDVAARTYDDDFTRTRLGRWLREVVHRELRPFVHPGTTVLELGAGTGEDAMTYAGWGARVTAMDASTEMLRAAEAKRAALPPDVARRVCVVPGDLEYAMPSAVEAGAPFELVVANFGVVNCVRDRARLFERLAAIVIPGGRMALVPMSPWCPWEIAWHLARGRPRDAFRRLRGRTRAHVGGGRTIEVDYPTTRRLADEATPGFRLVRSVAVGTLLPPSYLAPVVDRHPGVYDRVRRLEERVHGRPGFRSFTDHTLTWFERTP